MNTTQLQYFVNVAQTRSLRKSAYFCNTSPSTVSSALKDLSNELLVPLYYKTPYGIELTEEGLNFYDVASNALLEIKKTIQFLHINQLKLSGSLNLAATDGITSFIFPSLSKALVQSFPELNVQFLTAPNKSILEKVSSRQADIGYIITQNHSLPALQKQYPHLNFFNYIDCASVFLITKNHPLASKVTITRDEISPYPIVFYSASEFSENIALLKKYFPKIHFTQNELYSTQLIQKYNYLSILPFLNGTLSTDFFDIHSQAVLIPKKILSYYVTGVYLKNSPKTDLLSQYLTFANLFY